MATHADQRNRPFPGIEVSILDSLRSLTAIGILIRVAHQQGDEGLTLNSLAAHPDDDRDDIAKALDELVERGMVVKSFDDGTITYRAAAVLGGGE